MGVFACMCVKVGVLLIFSMFVYVLLLARTYIPMFAYVLGCIFAYLHIFLLSADGKG